MSCDHIWMCFSQIKSVFCVLHTYVCMSHESKAGLKLLIPNSLQILAVHMPVQISF